MAHPHIQLELSNLYAEEPLRLLMWVFLYVLFEKLNKVGKCNSQASAGCQHLKLTYNSSGEKPFLQTPSL